jgi:hypothetical protein
MERSLSHVIKDEFEMMLEEDDLFSVEDLKKLLN